MNKRIFTGITTLLISLSLFTGCDVESEKNSLVEATNPPEVIVKEQLLTCTYFEEDNEIKMSNDTIVKVLFDEKGKTLKNINISLDITMDDKHYSESDVYAVYEAVVPLCEKYGGIENAKCTVEFKGHAITQIQNLEIEKMLEEDLETLELDIPKKGTITGIQKEFEDLGYTCKSEEIEKE